MNPISNQVGAIFIPVNDIEKARDWYCDLLGLPSDGEILYGHLYLLPMEGIEVVLDSGIYAEDHVLKLPAFHFNTSDIHRAYAFVKSKNIELITEIKHNWFNFKDLDGNVLMICQC